jgi:choline dehydrogenase
VAVRYGINRTGPITASVCEAGMFVRSSEDVRSPDVQMHCLPAFVIDHGRLRVKGHGMTINTCHLRPRSVGQVTLHSADSDEGPDIRLNYLDDPYD